MLSSVAYLGFQKGEFSLATSAHTKGGGGKPSFPFVSNVKKMAQVAWPNGPPKNTPLVVMVVQCALLVLAELQFAINLGPNSLS